MAKTPAAERLGRLTSNLTSKPRVSDEMTCRVHGQPHVTTQHAGPCLQQTSPCRCIDTSAFDPMPKPLFSKGDLVWYRDRHGVQCPGKVSVVMFPSLPCPCSPQLLLTQILTRQPLATCIAEDCGVTSVWPPPPFPSQPAGPPRMSSNRTAQLAACGIRPSRRIAVRTL